MDRDEFAKRVRERERLLYCLARTMLPPADCCDAMQSAVLRAWEHLDTLKKEAAFDSWLNSILINECRKLLRLKKREYVTDFQSISLISPETDPDLAVGEALNALSPEDRMLLLLHHDEGYSLAEVSMMMKQPQGVLKMRLYRARSRLRKALEERGVSIS